MTQFAADCPSPENDEVASRYAVGKLAAEEAAAFEAHMLGCARCQDAVLESSALAAAVREPNESSWRWSVARLAWLVPVAAALLLTTLLVRSRNDLSVLARVDVLPAFNGTAVRTTADEATRAADSGMAAYVRGDYRAAAALLERATPNAAVTFYLGVALLISGDHPGALVALRSTQLAGSPYAPEASLYLAKAWLAVGRADSALVALSEIDTERPGGRHAAALADSIRKVMAR